MTTRMMGNDDKKKHGQYSGIPTDAVASAVASTHEDDDASLPIATAVSLTGTASRRGSSASTNQTPTTKAQRDGTDKKSSNIHDVAGTDDDSDGIQITWEKGEVQLNRLRRVLRRQRESYRNRIILWGATGRLDDEAAGARLDAMRWLHRVSYHLWRIEHHLGRLETGSGAAASPRREAAIEVLED